LITTIIDNMLFLELFADNVDDVIGI